MQLTVMIEKKKNNKNRSHTIFSGIQIKIDDFAVFPSNELKMTQTTCTTLHVVRTAVPKWTYVTL